MDKEPSWWPPGVGDRLRLVDAGSSRLLHVVAVFVDDGRHFAVTKEWWRSKRRWNYEVIDDIKATIGAVYPAPPEER